MDHECQAAVWSKKPDIRYGASTPGQGGPRLTLDGVGFARLMGSIHFITGILGVEHPEVLRHTYE